MTERDKISARIRALRAKTVENGCTEAEAIAAAEKVAKLLADYDLTVDEAEMRQTPFSRHDEKHYDAVGERLGRVAAAISELTGATWFRSQNGVHPIEITFFGFAHEVDVARYLLEICARAMRRACSDLDRANALLRPARRRMIVVPFLDGMADRLHVRIKALIPPKPTGKGLVVLRDQLVKAALADAGIEITDIKGRSSRRDDAAYREGQRAGDGVALNRGLGGGPTNGVRLGDGRSA
jgi:Protein of unknown function (DUF2786)